MALKQGFIHISSPDGNLSLELRPESGGSIGHFKLRRKNGVFDLFRPYSETLPQTPLNMASFPLTPYSNRIINGRLTVGGKGYDIGPLHAPEPHQLHGDGWLQSWTVEETGQHYASLTLHTKKAARTPYVYDAKQVFTLANERLDIDMEVTNRSGFALPFGLGHHPYFIRNEKTVLKARLPKVWHSRNIVPEKLADTPPKWDFSKGIGLADAHFHPPSEGFRGTDLLDHCFQGWDQVAEIAWPDAGVRLAMKADPVFRNFVIYIPNGQNFFCAEPVTNINDGFNLKEKGVPDTGTVMLQDGETLKGKIWFEVEAA
jgi:aldose 1-epimerase